MSILEAQLEDLVIANRILAHEGVVDGFGHVSLRHPERHDRFFMSRSRSPELVTRDDIMEFDLDCNPIDQRGRVMYGERAIHGAIFQTRPDVGSVVHNHAHEIIPYSVTKMPMRQVIHTAGGMGHEVPVWDIRDDFGDTDMLVRNLSQGLKSRKNPRQQRGSLDARSRLRGHRQDGSRRRPYCRLSHGQRSAADRSHAFRRGYFPFRGRDRRDRRYVGDPARRRSCVGVLGASERVFTAERCENEGVRLQAVNAAVDAGCGPSAVFNFTTWLSIKVATSSLL